MYTIVFKFRLFILFFGLMTLFSCTNEKDVPANTSKTNNDSIAVLVNQKPSKSGDFDASLKNFTSDPALQHANISIAVLDNASGEEIAAYQANQSVIPASSLKIIATATGLAILGKDYRFKTEIRHSGTIKNGVLNGNIYIKAYGDPTLGSDQMDGVEGLDIVINKFVSAIQNAGIHSIQGHIVGDASALPTAVNAPTWPWNDLGNYYASGAWGLNIHENLYYLHLQQHSSLGGQPKVTKTVPEIDGLQFQNELTSAARGSGDNAYIYGAPYTKERFIRGTIPLGNGGFKIKGSIPNPPLFAAQYLKEKLAKKGIQASQSAISNLELDAKNSSTQLIFSHQSPPLSAIAKRCNLKSVNLYAEAILRAIALEKTGKGDLSNGINTTMDFWKQKGFNTTGFFMEDASGLSPRNGASAQHLNQFLYLISKDKNLYSTFKNTLAIGGKTGTLKLMFKGTSAEGNIWGKSGSMSRIRTYTGYAKSKSGKNLSFSFLVNNYTCSSSEIRKKMERLMVEMCSSL